jgi:hypothetical protein
VVYQANVKGECCAFQAPDNNAEVRGNHEFQASDDNAEVRGNHEFQASDNNAEVKAIMNSKHETSENTELRGDPSITH